MCYNAKVSGSTFLFVAGISLILWKRATHLDRPLALILTFIALMQLIEWALWLQMPACNTANRTLSSLIPVYLALQPIVLNLVVGAFGAGWAGGYEYMALLMAVTVLPAQLYDAYKGWMGSACTTLSPDGNLEWPIVVGDLFAPIYHIGMLYPLVTLKSPTFAALYVLFSVLSFWRIKGTGESKAWPSLWCHFVNLLAVFAIST